MNAYDQGEGKRGQKEEDNDQNEKAGTDDMLKCGHEQKDGELSQKNVDAGDGKLVNEGCSMTVWNSDRAESDSGTLASMSVEAVSTGYDEKTNYSKFMVKSLGSSTASVRTVDSSVQARGERSRATGKIWCSRKKV